MTLLVPSGCRDLYPKRPHPPGRIPAYRRCLAVSVRAGGLGVFLVRKGASGPCYRKTEYDGRAFHRPGILIQNLDDKRGHEMALQVIHFAISGEGNNPEALYRVRGGRLRGRHRLLRNGLR